MEQRLREEAPESTPENRLIAHVDMDAFFVSVERMEPARSRGKARHRGRQRRAARRGLRCFL